MWGMDGEVREQIRIFPLVSGLGNRVPNEGNVREKRLGSGANGSAAPERSLGWRQSVQGPAVGSARELGQATSALALTCPGQLVTSESHRGAGGGARVEQELSLLQTGGGAFSIPSPDIQTPPGHHSSERALSPTSRGTGGLREDTAVLWSRPPRAAGITGAPGHGPGTEKVSLSPSSPASPSSIPDRGVSRWRCREDDMLTAGTWCSLWDRLCAECLAFQPHGKRTGQDLSH